jgi:hypothetical protein
MVATVEPRATYKGGAYGCEAGDQFLERSNQKLAAKGSGEMQPSDRSGAHGISAHKPSLHPGINHFMLTTLTTLLTLLTLRRC